MNAQATYQRIDQAIASQTAPKVPLIHCEIGDMANATDALAEITQRLMQRLSPYCLQRPASEGTCDPETALPKFGEELRQQRRKVQEAVNRLNLLMDTLEL